jgi:hypothetical protein
MVNFFDELFIYKVISFVLTFVVALWGIKKLGPGKGRIIFSFMLGSFFLSAMLFFPEGRINDWLKHIPFYFGQLLFYFWLENIFGKTSRTQAGGLAQAVVVPTTGGFIEWFNYLTDQGLQHILTLPFLILIVAVIKVRFGYIQSNLKTTLNILLLAATALTMIHVGEFVVESQNWLPFLVEWIEQIEFLWYYLALGLFALGVKRLSQIP